MRSAAIPSLALVLAASSCGNGGGGDPAFDAGLPSPLGSDLRIHDVMNPTLPNHASYLAVGNPTSISGAQVVAVDTFDETGNGKSAGTIYLQDLGAKDPFSGTSLFAPSFVPGNLHVGANDVLDLTGQYQENTSIGPTVTFAPPSSLAQISRPTATFRFEAGRDIEPLDIDIADLADWSTGQRWMNMLVRVKNVAPLDEVSAATVTGGRLSARLSNAGNPAAQKCQDPFPKPPTLTNELFDASTLNIKVGQKITELVGVVTFFCNIHIAPRNANDVKL